MKDKVSSRSYRNWTNIEDAKLVEALVNMVNSGAFKADNGFKPGYLQHIEGVLKEAIPDSGILAKPHIESRIKTMKKDWQVVHDMFYGSNTSGFGFDNEKHCVIAEPPVWESYLQVHKEAAKWKHKSFPLFEDLCNVFGKDRAQGNRARDFVEMEEDANREEAAQEPDDESDEAMEVSFTAPTTPHTTTAGPSEECSSARPKKKKARTNPLLEGITSAATLLGSKIEEASTKMSEALQADLDVQRKTSMVNSELSKIASLSAMDRYKAARKIICEPENLLFFFSMEEGEREGWVRFLLDSDA